MISCYAQIINDYVLGYKIPELVKHEKIKARKLSYDSQVYLLMLGQFLHVFSLNELVDISKIYAKELSRIRGISPASLNTFSNGEQKGQRAKEGAKGSKRVKYVLRQVCIASRGKCEKSFSEAFVVHKRG
jgi:hypothetical protein